MLSSTWSKVFSFTPPEDHPQLPRLDATLTHMSELQARPSKRYKACSPTSPPAQVHFPPSPRASNGSKSPPCPSHLSFPPMAPPSLSPFSNARHHSIRTRTIRDQTSARISVPSLLRRQDLRPPLPDGASAPGPWTWHTDLAATQPFWTGWFAGLSAKFLKAGGGKLLLLAGTDRLDKELMIGQMQGTFTSLIVFSPTIDSFFFPLMVSSKNHIQPTLSLYFFLFL